MRISFFIPLFLLISLFVSPQRTTQVEMSTPLPPEAGSPSASIQPEPTVVSAEPVRLVNTFPTQLRISSIRLNSPIVSVGVNGKGEMDVPSGKTNQVGWYESGTVPGDVGSAVLDAHVYAAFKKLKLVGAGDNIYVTTADGRSLLFKVTETHLYALNKVPLDRLFNATDGKHLNLITCAGTWSPKMATYSDRLIVYATLIE